MPFLDRDPRRRRNRTLTLKRRSYDPSDRYREADGGEAAGWPGPAPRGVRPRLSFTVAPPARRRSAA